MFKIQKLELFDKIAIFLAAVFILAGSIVSVLRFWHYDVFYYDFGIFDTAIWKIAHLQAPIIDHLVVGGKVIFADHFSPSVFLFSPLYWFTDRGEALLISQALFVGLAGLVIYLTGVWVLKNPSASLRTSKLASLSVLISFYLFIGLQNAVISDFHEATVATLPFALTFYSIIKKNLKWFIVFGLITLGFKETMFLLGIAFGIFILFFNKKWLKIGLATSIFSLLYGFLAIKLVIPHFSGGFYFYSQNLNFEFARLITSFFDNSMKIDTMFKTFWSFSFLPVLSPAFWLLIYEEFITRFYSNVGTTRIDLGLHYSAILSVIMAVSSIFGLKFIISKISRLKFNLLLIIIILNSIFLYRFVVHGPLALSYNPAFYKQTKDFDFLNKMVQMIPKNASVMTQNNIAPHLTHSKNVWLLKIDYEKYRPDYILIDNRPGQNPNDFFGSDRNLNVGDFVSKISEDKNYKLIYKTKYQFVFKRI